MHMVMVYCGLNIKISNGKRLREQSPGETRCERPVVFSQWNQMTVLRHWCVIICTRYFQPGKLTWSLVSGFLLVVGHVDTDDCSHGDFGFQPLQKASCVTPINHTASHIKHYLAWFKANKDTPTRQDISKAKRLPPRVGGKEPNLSLGKINPLLHRV